MSRRIVILGGYGVFGRHIADALAWDRTLDLVVAGRDPVRGRFIAESIGASFAPCDLRDPATVRKVIADARLVINTVGPFQAADYQIPRACIDQGCHYLDLGDGRLYVAGISELHSAAVARNVFVCVGASTAPAVTSAMVAELLPPGSQARSIKVALTAGNKNQAGAATLAAILSYVGSPIRIRRLGQWRQRIGWGDSEFIDFPGPVGCRRVQLCDVPDLELFPRCFQADSVTFKAGVEMTIFNHALTALARLRQMWPGLQLPVLAGPLVRVSEFFKRLGTLHGSVAEWVTDNAGERRSLAIVARKNGPRVATAPAVLLARRIMVEEPTPGAYPCMGFLNLDEIMNFLAPFDIFLVSGENGKW